MNEDKLVNIAQLSKQLGPPVRQIRTLMRQRKIPFIKTGHRSCLFSVTQVREALSRFEVKACS